VSNEPETCPNCAKDLRDHKHPGYYLVIGCYDLHKDRTTEWLCPFCEHVWPRENPMFRHAEVI